MSTRIPQARESRTVSSRAAKRRAPPTSACPVLAPTGSSRQWSPPRDAAATRPAALLGGSPRPAARCWRGRVGMVVLECALFGGRSSSPLAAGREKQLEERCAFGGGAAWRDRKTMHGFLALRGLRVESYYYLKSMSSQYHHYIGRQTDPACSTR